MLGNLDGKLHSVKVANMPIVTPGELRYASASLLSGNTVIFNVKGNEYRLEVTVAYKSSIVVIRWVGTHREYDERNRHR